MSLSNRLQTIANFIPQNTIVADIGTDHGYIALFLIENKICKKVIATDISKNSLDKIVANVKQTKYEKDIDMRVGDGLGPIKAFEVDTVVIAGMGGLLIKDILDKDKTKRDSITNFILQPNIAGRELREYLYQNNFQIMDEKLVKEDGKFYEVIWAQKGKDWVEDEIYYEIGEKLLKNKDPLLKEFTNNKIQMNQGILKELKGKESQRIIDRQAELEKNTKDLKVVLKEIESN